MAGAASFIDGAMKGYGFVDDIYRRNEYDKQRADTHGELMKARKMQNQQTEWSVDDQAAMRRASEFATGKMNMAPGQMDPTAIPAQADMTEAVPGVEMAPLPRAGVVPPVTGDATAPMPGLEKVNPLPAPMAMAAPSGTITARRLTIPMRTTMIMTTPTIITMAATSITPHASALRRC